MKEEFNEAQNVINKAKFDLSRIFNNTGDNNTVEDQEVWNTLKEIIEHLESAEDYLNYLNAPLKEGVLGKDHETGEYFIAYDDGTESHDLSCGSKIELFIDDEWDIGSIDARDEQFYFNGSDQLILFIGMRVRKRKNENTTPDAI